MSRTLKLEEAISLIQQSLDWLNEAPIEELEAIEKAIEQNAPITQLTEALALLKGIKI